MVVVVWQCWLDDTVTVQSSYLAGESRWLLSKVLCLVTDPALPGVMLEKTAGKTQSSRSGGGGDDGGSNTSCMYSSDAKYL